MENIKVKIEINKRDNKTVEVEIDKNAKLRDLILKVLQKGEIKAIKHLKFVLADGSIFDKTTVDLLDKPIGNFGFGEKQTMYVIEPIGKTVSNDLSDFIVPTETNFLQDKKSENNKINENNKTTNIEKNERNWSLSRIIMGIADLLLLAAAIITFLLFFLTSLSVPVAVPIVLTALFVVGSVLFFGWNKILPKILPKGCLEKLDLGIDLNEEYKNEIEETENDKGNNPEKEDEYKLL